MLLPTAWCPSCAKTAVVYRTVADDAPTDDAPLQSRCVDCDTRLDRFGEAPTTTDCSPKDLESMGYPNLDKAPPVAPGGCHTTRGCEGCPKIDSRPW